MKRRIPVLVACLLIGLVAIDIALGADCDPLVSGAAQSVASHADTSDERCATSVCASDCFCCTVVNSGAVAPTLLAPGLVALSLEPQAAVAREGTPARLYHPPLS